MRNGKIHTLLMLYCKVLTLNSHGCEPSKMTFKFTQLRAVHITSKNHLWN